VLIAAFIAAATVGSVPVPKVGVIVKGRAGELSINDAAPTTKNEAAPQTPRLILAAINCARFAALMTISRQCALDATVLELQQNLCRPPGSRQQRAFTVHRSGLLTEDEKNSDTLLGQMPAYACGTAVMCKIIRRWMNYGKAVSKKPRSNNHVKLTGHVRDPDNKYLN
jgi:hypothetical protein